VLQRVAACCSVLQRVAACCSVLQRIAVCCRCAGGEGRKFGGESEERVCVYVYII